MNNSQIVCSIVSDLFSESQVHLSAISIESCPGLVGFRDPISPS